MLLFSSTIQPLHNLCQHILYVWMLLCCAKYPGTAFSTLQDLNSCLFSAHLAHSKFRDNDMADNEQQFDSSCALTFSRNPVIVCASFRLWFTRMDDAVTHCPQYWPLTPADCQTGCYNQPQTDDTCRDEAFSQSCSLAFTPTADCLIRLCLKHSWWPVIVSLHCDQRACGTGSRQAVLTECVSSAYPPLASVALSRALGCTAGGRLPGLASAAHSHRVL